MLILYSRVYAKDTYGLFLTRIKNVKKFMFTSSRSPTHSLRQSLYSSTFPASLHFSNLWNGYQVLPIPCPLCTTQVSGNQVYWNNDWACTSSRLRCNPQLYLSSRNCAPWSGFDSFSSRTQHRVWLDNTSVPWVSGKVVGFCSHSIYDHHLERTHKYSPSVVDSPKPFLLYYTSHNVAVPQWTSRCPNSRSPETYHLAQLASLLSKSLNNAGCSLQRPHSSYGSRLSIRNTRTAPTLCISDPWSWKGSLFSINFYKAEDLVHSMVPSIGCPAKKVYFFNKINKIFSRHLSTLH